MFGFRMSVQHRGLHIVLRPYAPEEAVAMVAGMQSYQVTRYLATRSAQTEASEAAWLKKSEEDPNATLWAVCLVEDGVERPVGSTTLHGDANGKYGVSGIVLYDRESWGRGIASCAHLARTLYAFTIMDWMAIRSAVAGGNTASRRALENVGYAKVGMYYHIGIAESGVLHNAELLCVNPAERSWNYFWGDTKPPQVMLKARERAAAALQLAEHVVTFD
jgi:RimJ/RimL family protein N-acetyltransferase